MKDLIIGSSDNLKYADLHNWITSIKTSGFSGDIVVIVYRHTDELLRKLEENNVIAVLPESDWKLNELTYDQTKSENHVCQRRFFHIWQFLEQTEEKYRYVIHNDVKDVIYQSNPSLWLETVLTGGEYDLVAAGEGIRYDGEPWGKNDFNKAMGPYFYEYYARQYPVVNAGTFAGLHNTIKQLCMLIFLIAHSKSNEAADQAALNLLVNSVFKEKTFYGTLRNGWSCQCEIMMDPHGLRSMKDKIDDSPVIRNGCVYNNENIQPVLVHQYNRISNLLPLINQRYANIV
jgi:hypothetical protein